MNTVPNYGPWHKGKDASKEELDRMYPPEEREKLIAEMIAEGKGSMLNICYSPPFQPMDENLCKIWDALLSMGIVEIQMVEKDGKLGVVPYVNQTINLVSGKFYPIEPYGGEEQQKAIVPHLKNA